jgi:hypothetical protein
MLNRIDPAPSAIYAVPIVPRKSGYKNKDPCFCRNKKYCAGVASQTRRSISKLT